jgi:catechol 2,3-dioxygenase
MNEVSNRVEEEMENNVATVPVMPTGMNHVVINVYDMEESHKFWTEVVGLKLVGKLKPGPGPNGQMRPKMQFYAGHDEGHRRHHDIAFVENANLPPRPAEGWNIYTSPNAINHLAFEFPNREAWLGHLKFMQDKGVAFKRKIDHGMSHSVYLTDPNGYGVELLYELPRDVWENDIDGALNYAKERPSEGSAALEDITEVPRFGAVS